MINKYIEIGYVDQQLGIKNVGSVGICIGIGPYRVGTFDGDFKADKERYLPSKRN